MEDFIFASNLDPSLTDGRFNQAVLLNTLGKYKEAELEFSKVLEIDPEDSSAYLMRAET